MKRSSQLLLVVLLSLNNVHGNKNEEEQRYIFPSQPPSSFVKDIASIIPSAHYTLSMFFGAAIGNAGLASCTESPCSKNTTVQIVVGALAIGYGLCGHAQKLLTHNKHE